MTRYLDFIGIVWWRFFFLIFIGLGGTTCLAALTEVEYQQVVAAYNQIEKEPLLALNTLNRLQPRLADEPLETRAQISYLLIDIYQRLSQWDLALKQLLALQQQLSVTHPLYLRGEIWLIYLYYQQQDYSLCITQTHKIFDQQADALTSAQAAEASILLSYCYYHQQQLEPALYWSEQANQRSLSPNPMWLRFNLSLYQHLQQWKAAIHFIEQRLLPLFPNDKIYWQSLVSAYLQLKEYSKALSVMELMSKYIQFDEALYIQHIYLYRLLKLPYQAALQLELALAQGKVLKSRAHYLLLTDLWVQARHRAKAIHALNTLLNNNELGTTQQNGEILLKRATLAIQQGDWRLLQLSLLDAQCYLSDLNTNWTLWLAKSFIQQEAWLQAEKLLENLLQQDNEQVRSLLNYIHFMYQSTK